MGSLTDTLRVQRSTVHAGPCQKRWKPQSWGLLWREVQRRPWSSEAEPDNWEGKARCLLSAKGSGLDKAPQVLLAACLKFQQGTRHGMVLVSLRHQLHPQSSHWDRGNVITLRPQKGDGVGATGQQRGHYLAGSQHGSIPAYPMVPGARSKP